MEKYGPEKTPYLDTFRTVKLPRKYCIGDYFRQYLIKILAEEFENLSAQYAPVITW